MGPIEIIEAAARGAAEFAKKHVVLTAMAAASGASYVAYQNHNEADRAVGGGVVKQDVAVKDMRGDLSLKMQGLKEAPKANEPAKADVKSGNDEILKKLQDAAKDAGIMAEAAKAGSGAKTASTTSEAASSGKTEIAKTGGKKADGSATETGKGTLSGTKDSSDNKTETANTSNNSGLISDS